MTKVKGLLQKMAVRHAAPVDYSFALLDNGTVLKDLPPVNNYLGQELHLHFTGKIHCITCNTKVRKTYQQGMCFPCTQRLACADICIIKPEKCHFEQGTCREPEWALSHCFIPHIVYLANSSGLKVGVTRETQLPTRWIDQGATQALAILRVKSRLQAGLLEVAISKIINDKTNWRKMLSGESAQEDLAKHRDRIFFELSAEIQSIAGKFEFGDIEMLTNKTVHNFTYPILQYPAKITTQDFDKQPSIGGVLHGIKGQYLLFDRGVINMRKFTGYEIELQLNG